MTGSSTEMYTTYASVGCSVGVGVGVAMGVMVGVANVAVRETVVATKGNRGIWLRGISTGLHVYILHVQLPSEQHMKAVLCPQFTDLACIITLFVLTLTLKCPIGPSATYTTYRLVRLCGRGLC